MTTSLRQARNDDRDGARVRIFVIVVFALVFVGALLYFFAVDKRGEGPAHEAPPPATQQQGPATGPGASDARATQANPGSPAAPAR